MKFFAFCALLVLFILHHEFIKIFVRNSKRTKYYLKSIQLHSRLGLKLLNVKVKVDDFKQVKQRLIVANHLSYLDVLVLCSYYPSLFITSVEVRDTFMLGRISKLAGCFFVERRKSLLTKEKSLQEISEMKSNLKSGHNVSLFPEGTSSSGASVLPFKNTFFQLAIDGDIPVQPICLNYGPYAEVVAWYGDMTFADHLFNLCQQPKIIAQIKHLPILESHEMDRFQLATKAHQIISEAYLKA